MISKIGKIIIFSSLLIFNSWLFMNCSGANSAKETNTQNVTVSGLGSFTGDWLHNMCTTGIRALTRVTLLNENTLAYAANQLQYANTNCTGASTLVDVNYEDVATVKFRSLETDGFKKYYRGTWMHITEPDEEFIWAVWDANTICIVGDTTPTAFASAQAITDAITQAEASIPGIYCHSKYP